MIEKKHNDRIVDKINSASFIYREILVTDRKELDTFFLKLTSTSPFRMAILIADR